MTIKIDDLISINKKEYRVIKPSYSKKGIMLGMGGMAYVYLVGHIDPYTGRVTKFALKQLLPQFRNFDEVKKYFEQEAQIGTKLKHRHVIKLVDYGENQFGDFCLVMEYIKDGYTLKDRLKNLDKSNQKMEREEIEYYLRELCKGLGYIHHEAPVGDTVFHRDIKPANILLDETHLENGLPRVVITDFGISLMVSEKHDPLFGAGTVDYMAPELYRLTQKEADTDESKQEKLPASQKTTADLDQHKVQSDLGSVSIQSIKKTETYDLPEDKRTRIIDPSKEERTRAIEKTEADDPSESKPTVLITESRGAKKIRQDNKALDRDSTISLGADQTMDLRKKSIYDPSKPRSIDKQDWPKIDHRVDLYALGILLHEMVYQERPEIITSPKADVSKAKTPPTMIALPILRKSVSIPFSKEKQRTFVKKGTRRDCKIFDPIIEKLLNENPDDRYPRASKVIEALDKSLRKDYKMILLLLVLLTTAIVLLVWDWGKIEKETIYVQRSSVKITKPGPGQVICLDNATADFTIEGNVQPKQTSLSMDNFKLVRLMDEIHKDVEIKKSNIKIIEDRTDFKLSIEVPEGENLYELSVQIEDDKPITADGFNITRLPPPDVLTLVITSAASINLEYSDMITKEKMTGSIRHRWEQLKLKRAELIVEGSTGYKSRDSIDVLQFAAVENELKSTFVIDFLVPAAVGTYSYTFIVEPEIGQPVSKTVKVRREAPPPVPDIEIIPPSPPDGKLTVRILPVKDSYEIYLDGDIVKTGNGLENRKVESGRRILTIVSPKYKYPNQTSVEVESNELSDYIFRLRRVTVGVKGVSGAEIEVNGHKVGQAPVVDLLLLDGQDYTFKALGADFPPIKRRIGSDDKIIFGN